MSSDIEIDDILRRLVQSKKISVKTEGEEDYYSLTPKEFADIEAILRQNEDTQLFLFTLFFRLNKKRKGKGDKYSVLKETVNFITKFNPNFLGVLEKACREGRIKGLKLRKGVES